MSHADPTFLGVDLGTGGVRAVVVSDQGEVVARAAVSLPAEAILRDANRHEQDPQAWWQAVCQATREAVEQLHDAGHSAASIAGLAVDGTSGTIVPLAANGEPLCPALMYNDARSGDAAAKINALAGDWCERVGHRFNSSFGLPKALWLAEQAPDLFRRAAVIAHQADFVVGKLSGRRNVTEYSSALKTGFDLIDETWPAWLGNWPDILRRLPQVVGPGTVVGQVTPSAAQETGLPLGLAVVAGASDGTAALIASGAARHGDYNTTLGTTLVFKGVSPRVCRHPQGAIYSHKLPGGLWLPGAASNVGGAWIPAWFAGHDRAALDADAAARLPPKSVAYPLVGRGERFPFLAPDATDFCLPQAECLADRYAACLAGVACVERMAYSILDEAMGITAGDVYSAGGGSTSDVWMQCRADATGRRIHRAACPESAFGGAVLAAAGTRFDCLATAARQMVRIERTFVPDGLRAAAYDELYARLLEELSRRGYVKRCESP